MKMKGLIEYLGKDFPDLKEITEETRKENKKKIFMGGVRINNGMYRTTKENIEYRNKIRNTQLP